MSQRKLIAMAGIVALVGLSAGTSFASWSRVESMGLGEPVLSQFIDDTANIYTYPTSVVRQNNLVLVELGNNADGDVNEVSFDDQSMTVIRHFPSLGSIAFQMKQNALNSPSLLWDNLTHEQLDIIWGKAFEKVDFAIRLDITNSRYEYTDNSPSTYQARGADFSFDPYPFGGAFGPDAIAGTGTEINTLGITPAIAIHMENDNRVEGAVTYRKYSLERMETAGGTAGESWQDGDNSSFMVIARGVVNQHDQHTWYPAVWYRSDDLSWEVTGVTPTARTADETYKQIGVGISDNMRVNDNNHLIWGVVVGQGKHKYERTDANDGVASGETRALEEKTTVAPLVFAAVETEATSWLKVRFGASRMHQIFETDFTDFDTPTFSSNEKERASEFSFSLGTGIRFNNLDVDMTMNEAFPLSGGYILSGDNETPFTRVSATYHF